MLPDSTEELSSRRTRLMCRWLRVVKAGFEQTDALRKHLLLLRYLEPSGAGTGLYVIASLLPSFGQRCSGGRQFRCLEVRTALPLGPCLSPCCAGPTTRCRCPRIPFPPPPSWSCRFLAETKPSHHFLSCCLPASGPQQHANIVCMTSCMSSLAKVHPRNTVSVQGARTDAIKNVSVPVYDRDARACHLLLAGPSVEWLEAGTPHGSSQSATQPEACD